MASKRLGDLRQKNKRRSEKYHREEIKAPKSERDEQRIKVSDKQIPPEYINTGLGGISDLY